MTRKAIVSAVIGIVTTTQLQAILVRWLVNPFGDDEGFSFFSGDGGES
jgi:hypothetical protein